MDRFDEVFSVLTEDQGWSEENARKIMVYCVEQGMNPIEAGARFVAGMAGLPSIDLRKNFFNPWNMFPKKPEPQRGLPKTGPSSPLPTQKLLPPAKPIPTPKQTQGMLGSRSVPNIQQVSTKYGLDTPAPKPQFGPGSTKPIGPNPAKSVFNLPPADAGIKARNALNTPKPPAAKPNRRGGLLGLATLAASILDGGRVADGTLQGALKRGDYKPVQGPPVPKAPEKKVETPEREKITPRVKRPEPPKPVDSRLQKYRDLIKQGKHGAARELGKQIHADRYGIPTTKTT